MASKNKTPYLSLNQWDGTDCPKRTDFNDDNLKIDTAVKGHVTGTAAHVSASDRAAWDASDTTVGRYSGNGAASRTISIASAINSVIVVRENYPPATLVNGRLQCYSAAAVTGVPGFGVELSGTAGFTLKPASADGTAVNLNENGVNYLFIACK